MTQKEFDSWNNFIHEFQLLERKYGVKIDTGCTCCFGAHKVGGSDVRVKDSYGGCGYVVTEIRPLQRHEVDID